VNELSFLEEITKGPLVRHRNDPDFVVAQWFRDALNTRGCLVLGVSRRAGDGVDGEASFTVLGLTPAGETYLAALRAERWQPLWSFGSPASHGQWGSGRVIQC
jgi:hypothetical protein